MADFQTVNSHVVSNDDAENVLTVQNLLKGISYVTYLNNDKEAINAEIFHMCWEHTHSLDPCQTPPSHTIIIKAADYVILPATNAYTIPILNDTCTCFTLIVKHFTRQHNS